MPETNFFWDPLSDNILQERDGVGALTAKYTAEPGLYGNVISQDRGGVESQFHYDAQGSTLAVTDDNQQVTDTRAYSGFGDTSEGTGSTTFPFQYVGQKEYITTLVDQKYRARRRIYQPASSRWLALDPLDARNNTSNLYVYSHNRPTIAYDPSGLVASLNVQLNAKDCAWCTGYQVQWNYDVPPHMAEKKWIVVQELKTLDTWRYCPHVRTCTGQETCVEKEFHRCTHTAYEFLNVIAVRKVIKQYISVDTAYDTWKSTLSNDGDHSCWLRGTSLTIAHVRAFRYVESRDPTSGKATDAWKSGKIECGYDTRSGVPPTLEYGFYLDKQPVWWNEREFEASVMLRRAFDCCSRPHSTSMIAKAVGAGGFGGGKTLLSEHVKDCHKNDKLPDLGLNP